MITLTENAATAIRRFISGSETPVSGLRVLISGGGCSGFQYGLRLEETPAEEDTVVECNGVQVFIDPTSTTLLSGIVIDFIDNIDGAGFKFENPNATATCGCGNSFSA